MSEINLVYPPDLKEDTPYIRFKIDLDGGKFICLPQPPGLSFTDGAAYGTMDLTLVEGGGEVFKKMIQGRMGGEGVGSTDVAAAALFGKEAFANFVGDSTANLGVVNALKQKVAVNKYTRLTYETQNIRTFTFAFKFAAQSSEESDIILKIERLFRKAAYPKKVGAIALRYPPTVEIAFMLGDTPNPYLPQIFRTNITSFNAIFNSSTNAFHKQGQPIEVDMSIELSEDSQNYRDENTDEIVNNNSAIDKFLENYKKPEEKEEEGT